MAELGLPGLLLIVAVRAVRARRRDRRPAPEPAQRRAPRPASAATAGLVVFLVQASVDWMWQSTAVTVLALGGVAIVSSRSTAPAAIAAPGRTRAAAGGAGGDRRGGPDPGPAQHGEIDASQSAARAGNGATALAWADHAVGGRAVGGEPLPAARARARVCWGDCRPPTPTSARATASRADELRAVGDPVPDRDRGGSSRRGGPRPTRRPRSPARRPGAQARP